MRVEGPEHAGQAAGEVQPLEVEAAVARDAEVQRVEQRLHAPLVRACARVQPRPPMVAVQDGLQGFA